MTYELWYYRDLAVLSPVMDPAYASIQYAHRKSAAVECTADGRWLPMRLSASVKMLNMKGDRYGRVASAMWAAPFVLHTRW